MFIEKYRKAIAEKNSIININLDPALPRQRQSKVIPARFASASDEEVLFNFCMETIEEVGDYCCSIKPNTQYFLGAFGILKKLVKKIHSEGMIAILDHKLSDIGSTNESAIFWIAEMGFDAFTFSPFAGNTSATVTEAHKRDLGVIVLTLMSNPEAQDLMVNTIVNGEQYYMYVARAVAKAHADGCVVGLTTSVKSEYIRNIQEIVGDEIVLLMQGIGPQGGEPANVKYATNPLASLGREVLYSKNPQRTVERYYNLFKSIMHHS